MMRVPSIASLSMPEFDTVKCKNLTADQYREAVNFLQKAQPPANRGKVQFLLVDSGANHHIFNDAKWFAGFNDLQRVDMNVTTGSGTAKCHYKGTASALIMNENGDTVLVIFKNALLIEDCPFCIISQNMLSERKAQCVASFYNEAGCDPRMTIRCMTDTQLRSVGLHRMEGLDFASAVSPGTLGGVPREQILINANTARAASINAAKNKVTASVHAAAVSEGTTIRREPGVRKYNYPKVFLSVAMFPALMLRHAQIGFNAACYLTDSDVDWCVAAARGPSHGTHQSALFHHAHTPVHCP